MHCYVDVLAHSSARAGTGERVPVGARCHLQTAMSQAADRSRQQAQAKRAQHQRQPPVQPLPQPHTQQARSGKQPREHRRCSSRRMSSVLHGLILVLPGRIELHRSAGCSIGRNGDELRRIVAARQHYIRKQIGVRPDADNADLSAESVHRRQRELARRRPLPGKADVRGGNRKGRCGWGSGGAPWNCGKNEDDDRRKPDTAKPSMALHGVPFGCQKCDSAICLTFQHRSRKHAAIAQHADKSKPRTVADECPAVSSFS